MRLPALLALTLLSPFSPIEAASASTTPCVLLLHGLARSSKSMNEMESQLQNQGFQVFNIDYPSTQHPIDTLSQMAIGATLVSPAAQSCGTLNFVTHSLGGILVRHYLAHNPVPRLGRVVMLGPPNRGSEVVDNLRDWSLFQYINGPAGQELGTDSASAPNTLDSAHFEVGIIAGDRSINWINSQMIPGSDDGKVSVESTRLRGMKDHITLHTTHPMMMQNKYVIAQVVHFLRHGVFQRSSPASE